MTHDLTRNCGNCEHYSEASRPGESKAPARGGWCMAPVPSWCRVAMDDARVLPTRGLRCPAFKARAPFVDSRQTTLLGDGR